MTARRGPFQSSVNAGELDPLVIERGDLAASRAGLKKMRGFEPVPQSGFRLMPGSRRHGLARRTMTVIAGLDAATTSFGPHSSDTVVYTQALDPTLPVAAVTLEGWKLSSGQSASARVELEIASVWTTLSDVLPMTDVATTFTLAQEPSKAVDVTGVRVVLVTSTSTTVAAGTVTLRQESATLVVPRLETLSKEAGQTYTLSMIPGFGDIWRMGADTGAVSHVGAFVHEMSAAELADQHTFATDETVGFFSENLKTPRLLRRGSDHAWQVDDWPYGPVGTVDYGGVYPKTDDKHEVSISWSGGDIPYLSLTVEGEDTAGVDLGTAPGGTTAPQWAAFATKVQTAIRALPSMTDDVSVVDDGARSSNVRVLEITFGGGLSGDEYEVLASISNTTTAAAVVTHTQIGKTDGEALLSDERGYPSTCVEVQQRLIHAGIAARPAAMVASSLGEYFNLNVQATGSDTAWIEALKADRSEKIVHLVWDKYLFIQTTLNEYFANNRDMSKDQPKNIVDAGSNHGSRRSCRPVKISGEIFFVNGNGELLLSASYDDVTTSYLTEPVSMLSSHMIEDVRRLGVQKGDTATDGDRLFALRGDGKLVQVMIIRGQDVFGMSWWPTSGTIDDLVADADNVVWLHVERDGPSGPVITLESFEENQVLHSAVDAGSSDAAGVVNGLEAFEGQEIWAIGDGYVLGPYTVSGASITLPGYAASVTVGLWTPPYAERLPWLALTDQGDIIRRPGRIASVRMRLVNTTSIAVGANSSTPREVTLTMAGDAVDAPPTPYNGLKTVTGLRGHVHGTTWVITQTRPGQCQVQNISLEGDV